MNRRFSRIEINYDAMKLLRLKYEYENPDELDNVSCEIVENDDSDEESESDSYEYVSN